MKPSSRTAIISPATISFTLLGLIVLCVVCYIYFVAASVLHVVVRQDAEVRSATIRSENAAFETQLIAAQHEISNRLALLDGYEDDEEKIFIIRGSDGVALGARSTSQ